MIFRSKRDEFDRRTRAAMFATAWFFMLAIAWPAQADNRAQPPWHIESFCRRGVPPAHRCLVRARQGIIVLQLAELASAPTVRWSDGVAALISGQGEASRQLRFFVPPQKLSATFTRVLAYNTHEQLVATYADGRVHLRSMFADDHDLAALAPPAGIDMSTLRARFQGRSVYASWRDSQGRAQEQTLRTQD